MNQKYGVAVIVVVILILVAGYFGRHKIKRLLGMSSVTPVVYQNQTPSPSETAATSSASATNTLTTVRSDPDKGSFLADSKGMTLYTFDADSLNKSNCSAGCQAIWSAFRSPSADTSNLPTNFGVITVSSNTFQYTYKGMPLYHYIKDSKPGDVLGDGVDGTWHIVKQ